VPGLEVAGTVIACGEAVLAWKEGDRVFGLVGGGGLADRVVVHERHVTRVPDRLNEEEAAAAPEIFITAHDAIRTQAGLRPGDVLLVNGANGGVGTAGVQVGLGAEPVSPDDFVERARAAGGADVVLELVGTPNLAGNLEALAPKGRIVIVGTGAGAEGEI